MNETMTVHWTYVEERDVFVMGFLDSDLELRGFNELERKAEETFADAYERMRVSAEKWCQSKTFDLGGFECAIPHIDDIVRERFCH